MNSNFFSSLAALLSAAGIAAATLLGLLFVEQLALAQGIAAAGAFAIGIILITRFPHKKRWLVAALVLSVVIILATGGFWFSLDRWGISDWDYYFSYHETIRRTVLTYHQLPLWNPYTCGGTAGLGDPEFSLFTPTFAFELLLGIPYGFRAAIYVATITGGLGMLLLGRRIGLSVFAALIAAAVYSLGSVNLLEIVEGHPNVFAAGWIPWIFWSWLAAYRGHVAPPSSPRLRPATSYIKDSSATTNGGQAPLPASGWARYAARKGSQWPLKLLTSPWSLVCGVFLALTFSQGGIYLLMYTGLSFIILPLLTRYPRQAYVVTIKAGIWALGLAAFKLLPVLFWLRQFQDEVYAGSKYTLPHLFQIFFGRHLHDAEVFVNQGSGWHEYGAYIGIVVAVLALVGLRRFTQSRLVRSLVITALLAILLSSAGPLLEPLFDRAPFLPRSNISRFILFAIIPLSLLAGKGLDTLRQVIRPRYRQLITVVLAGILAIDIMTLAYALSLQAFVLPPVVPAVSPAPSPIAFTAHTYEYRHKGDDYTRAYAATLAGYGTLSYCSVLTPNPRIRTIHDEAGNGYVSTSATAATSQVISWSPNNVVLAVDTPEETEVVINTNFAKGWQVNGQAAQEIVGRPAIKVGAGNHTLTFRYRTPGFTVGVLITMITISLALVHVWWLILRKNRS